MKLKGNKMKVFGIRNAPQKVRYTILNSSNDCVCFINQATENILKFPTTAKHIKDKILWLYLEYSRILDNNIGIEKIALKVNEYNRRGENALSRETAYYDAIAYLVASERGIPIEGMLYKQIGTKRKEVKIFAEEHVGTSEHYWDEQMADSIAAAWTVAGM